jgi:hypothetical protein
MMPDGQFCALAVLLRPNNGASAAPAIIERRVIRMNSSPSVSHYCWQLASRERE